MPFRTPILVTAAVTLVFFTGALPLGIFGGRYAGTTTHSLIPIRIAACLCGLLLDSIWVWE
jgi:hypothetical protein